MSDSVKLSALATISAFFMINSARAEAQSATKVYGGNNCLSGFIDKAPAVEDWGMYPSFDAANKYVMHLSSLKFNCRGYVTEVTIPFSTIRGFSWDNDLTLTLAVWREYKPGIYSRTGIDRVVMTRITNTTPTTTNIRGHAVTNLNANVRPGDILRLNHYRCGLSGYSKDSYGSYPPEFRRTYIPYLLMAQPSSSSAHGVVYVPVVSVNFTAETSGSANIPTGARANKTATSPVPNQNINTAGCDFPALWVCLVVVLTQVEATVVTAVVTALVMHCCCKTSRVKNNTRTEDPNKQTNNSTAQQNGQRVIYPENSSPPERHFRLDNTQSVRMQESPAYDLPVFESDLQSDLQRNDIYI